MIEDIEYVIKGYKFAFLTCSSINIKLLDF